MMISGRNKSAVQTKLPELKGPVSPAVLSNGILYASIVPRHADGTLETGEPELQVRLALENLRHTVEAAGGTLADVVQVVVHLTDRSIFPLMNDLYGSYFADRPYPNRAACIVPSLSVEGMVIEFVVQAHIGHETTQPDHGNAM